MYKPLFLALCMLTVGLAAPMATADHDSTSCEVTASEPTAEAEGFAVFVDEIAGDEYLYSIWVYQESNGLDGIQRHDSVVQDELCGHDGDTIRF